MRRLLWVLPLLSLVGAQCGEPPGHCTVSRKPRTGVATISCPDGTSVDVEPPAAGSSTPVASCTVRDNGNGTHTISCPDGSSTTVSNGQDGEDGPQGPAGQHCSAVRNEDAGFTVLYCQDGSTSIVRDGSPGDAAQPCSVRDNGDGTKTLSCPDGTSVVVQDGAQGASCTVSRDADAGVSTVACTDGTVATIRDGAPGTAGTSCTATRDADAGVTWIACGDGSGAVVRDGSPGAPGVGCTATRNGDAGTVTLACGDGSSATVSDGAPGANGSNGQPGLGCTTSRDADAGVTVITCEDGTSATVRDGAPGPAGDAGTVTVEPEPAGPNCASGGVRVSGGGAAQYVCNGVGSQVLGVDAGPDRVVSEGTTVTLAGSTAAQVLGVRWQQLLGPSVALSDVHAPAATFTAPQYVDAARRHVVLQLLATDGQVLESDLVVFTLNRPPSAPGIAVTPASPGDGDDLVCAVTSAAVDPEGDPVGYAFTWTRNGQPFSGETSAATTSTISGALTSPGDLFECQVTASDGHVVALSSTATAQVKAEGMPCAWTEVVAHDMSSMPAGSTKKNGALNGQGPASVGGRTAWLQTSDWNMLFLPAAYDATFQGAAIEADVYIPAAQQVRGAGVSLMVNPVLDAYSAFQNDIVHGLESGISCDSATAMLRFGVDQRASTSNRSICCSTGSPSRELFPGGATSAIPCASVVDRWVRLRLEASPLLGRGRLLLDGVELGTFTTDFDATGTRPKLGSGAPGYVAANVAFSDVRIYRGTCTP
ncbi:MAG: hypothetical protein FJ086_08300 [Deltaproteobacteria bacterium]|nr:hypothetical protein [Deltaproteobacteria bacterium]